MTKRFSFSPGAAVRYQGRSCTILEAVTASSVLIEDAETKETQVVPVSKLSRSDGEEKAETKRALDSLPEEDLAEAKRRFAIIKPFVRCERRSHKDLKQAAEQHGIGLSTIYRWIKIYEGRRLMSDLAPRRKGRAVNRRWIGGSSKFCVDHRGVFRVSRFASGATEDPTAQQVEAGSAIHRGLDRLQPVDGKRYERTLLPESGSAPEIARGLTGHGGYDGGRCQASSQA